MPYTLLASSALAMPKDFHKHPFSSELLDSEIAGTKIDEAGFMAMS